MLHNRSFAAVIINSLHNLVSVIKNGINSRICAFAVEMFKRGIKNYSPRKFPTEKMFFSIFQYQI
jgi:hypothetical protein